LSVNDIPICARIIAVADGYDAMISPRPYRAALSRGEALYEIERLKGVQFDPEVVEAFLGLSTDSIKPDNGRLLIDGDELSNKLLFKSVLFNKHARTAWLKEIFLTSG
jgi:hypothetical protein